MMLALMNRHSTRQLGSPGPVISPTLMGAWLCTSTPTLSVNMNLSTYKTASGFLLPSIHSAPPFFTQQPNTATQAGFTEQWTRLLLAYARHRRLFTLRLEDAEVSGGEWDEVLRNPRINRRLMPNHLAHVLDVMVSKDLAVYEPAKQTRAVLLYWRSPDEWADVLHEWVCVLLHPRFYLFALLTISPSFLRSCLKATNTGQLNTILTFYEISDPPVPSALSGIPESLLRGAIAVLAKSGPGPAD
ncbi:ESCRT-II complex vps25 subunit [Lactarius pseudohatsudake]|nr:ESCRT-II complex vps25 subunit [Lactarius pseudohatsudake]